MEDYQDTIQQKTPKSVKKYKLAKNFQAKNTISRNMETQSTLISSNMVQSEIIGRKITKHKTFIVSKQIIQGGIGQEEDRYTPMGVRKAATTSYNHNNELQLKASHDPEEFFSMNPYSIGLMGNYKSQSSPYKDSSRQKSQEPGPKFDEKGELIKRTVLGHSDLFKQTYYLKTGRDALGKPFAQNGDFSQQQKKQRSQNISLSFKNNQNTNSNPSNVRVSSRRVKYQQVKLNDTQLESAIEQIDQRIKINNRQTAIIENKIDLLNTSTICISQAGIKIPATEKKKMQSPYGPIIKQNADERKFETYQNYKTLWDKFKKNSNKYMANRTYSKRQKESLNARESVMNKTEQYQQKQVEIQALERATFCQKKFIPQQLWYDSLRESNEELNVRSKSSSNSQSNIRRREYFMKVESNKMNDLYARVKSINGYQSNALSSRNAIIQVNPSFDEKKLSACVNLESQSSLQLARNSQVKSVIQRDHYLMKKKTQNYQNYMEQMINCNDYENLKQLKIQGLCQFSREIQASKRIDPNQRYLCIDAQHINEQTGERESDLSKETMVEKYEKRLFY